MGGWPCCGMYQSYVWKATAAIDCPPCYSRVLPSTSASYSVLPISFASALDDPRWRNIWLQICITSAELIYIFIGTHCCSSSVSQNEANGKPITKHFAFSSPMPGTLSVYYTHNLFWKHHLLELAEEENGPKKHVLSEAAWQTLSFQLIRFSCLLALVGWILNVSARPGLCHGRRELVTV